MKWNGADSWKVVRDVLGPGALPEISSGLRRRGPRADPAGGWDATTMGRVQACLRWWSVSMSERYAVPTGRSTQWPTNRIKLNGMWENGKARCSSNINGEKIGKLQDVYVDVETDDSAVRHGQGRLHRPSSDLRAARSPDRSRRPTSAATKEQVESAPDIDIHGGELSQADESTLYHHFELNYTPIDTRERTAPGSSLR